jgi:hypothetical protein
VEVVGVQGDEGGGKAGSIYVRDGSPDTRAACITMTYVWDASPKIQRCRDGVGLVLDVFRFWRIV